MALVSIIIPSYRQPQFLGRAIESCLEQDHANLEIIVIDDRSRDSSLGLAVAMARSDDRITVIETPENGGLGRTRNIGLAKASGDYLCFLDSDDYLLPGSISSRLAAFPDAIDEYGDKLVAVYGDWQHVSESMDYPTVRAPRTNMEVVHAGNYTGENVFICSAPLVSRSAVLDAGGFPEGLPMLEDFALWSKMIAAGGVFAPVRHVVTTYRQRPNSMLRGEVGVTMADYVGVINEWMDDAGIHLADGGALNAWLEDRQPYSYGRMAWNVPSVLGDLGRGPLAGSLRSISEQTETPAEDDLADFMTSPVTTGLTMSVEPWIGSTSHAPSTAIVVDSLQDSLAAVGILERLGVDAAVFAEDSENWSSLWPLALAGIGVRPTSLIDTFSNAPTITEPRTLDDREALVQAGVAKLWPDVVDRAGSVVYVPDGFETYPALDAWISTALHSLAERDLAPRLMAEVGVRSHLGGYRSEITSVATLSNSVLVVAPPHADKALLAALAPTITFDPSSEGNANPQTKAGLLKAIDLIDVADPKGAER